MPKDLRDAFEKVCHTYDLVGIACHNGMLPHAIIAQEWGDSLIRLHERCDHHLAELRNDRGQLFWNDFTRLNEEAKRVWRCRQLRTIDRPRYSRPLRLLKLRTPVYWALRSRIEWLNTYGTQVDPAVTLDPISNHPGVLMGSHYWSRADDAVWVQVYCGESVYSSGVKAFERKGAVGTAAVA